jgi:antitoxin MazE
MKTTVPLAKIGNSQGIRLSKKLLQRYQFEGRLELETTPDAIILRPYRDGKLSWSETYQQMAAENDEFSDWEAVTEDGFDYEG